MLNPLELDLEEVSRAGFIDELSVTITTNTESQNLATGVEVVPLRLTYAGTIAIST